MDLRKLRDKGLLSGKGKGSATYYVPGSKLTGSGKTPHAPVQTPQAPIETPHASAQTPQALSEMPPAVPGDFSLALQADLRALGKHCRREKLNALIIRLCTQRPFQAEFGGIASTR